MNTRKLRLIAIFVPILFWIAILTVRLFIFRQSFLWEMEFVILLIYSIGAWFFSTWVFEVTEQREDEIRRRSQQLAALNEAALTLSKELELSKVLQKVVDLARDLVNARYGALGVLSSDGESLDQFITSGLPPERREQMGPPPHGDGLLGTLIREGKPVRTSDLRTDERAVGFPSHHPEMQSFLGVPIISKGQVYGNLYLTDKVSSPETGEGDVIDFTEEDQRILEMFATQAAIAIENAQLYRRIQELAVLQERERFGMDLHDGIIQSIYAIGLMLEDTQHRLPERQRSVREGIVRAIEDLNDVISDIRNYILDLRPQRFQGRDLHRGLRELAREIRANSFLNVHLETDSLEGRLVSAEQTVEILHIAQEALTNVRKHARATDVAIELSSENGSLELRIEDNGIGIDRSTEQARLMGNGLKNMQERAHAIEGEISVRPRKPSGTAVVLRVPGS